MEAEAVFATALACAKVEKSQQRIVEALLNGSRTKAILGRAAEGYKDIEEAYHIAPDDPDVLLAFSQSLRLQGDATGAMEVLRRVPVASIPYHGQMMLAMLLIERGNASDYREAADICSGLARLPEGMKADFREHVAEVALDALAKDSRIQDGHILLEELPKNAVSQIGLSTLRAKLCMLEDKQELAALTADEAFKIVTETTSPHDLRRLAVLLSELGRHKDALVLWQRVTVPSVLSGDTRRLLECASRLGRHDIMLDTFQALRNAGDIDRECLEHELALLERYDTTYAVEVLRQEIAKDGDKKLKLRLSVLGLALDRPELVEQDPSALPSVDEITPRMGIQAVQVLRANGYAKAGVAYAYELLRRHFDDVDAHRVLCAALAPFDPDPDIKKPESVELGTAVSYLEDGESVLRWVIVEDSSNPDAKLGELPTEHPICQQMLGKRVGEKFTLAEGIQNRTAQIREILSKYVYRYQDCMNQWQVRFPHSHDIQMVKIGTNLDDSGNEAIDISVIQKAVDERDENIKNTHKIYQAQQIPLHIVAEHLGTNTFEALRLLAAQLDVSIKCCFGSAEERQEASHALHNANTVVLDISAISALFSLQRLDLLENWPIDIIVSQATINELRQMIANEARSPAHEAGVFTKTDDGYAMLKQEPSQQKAYVDRLRSCFKNSHASRFSNRCIMLI